MGTPEEKRRSFGALITLLRKLGITDYVHIPVVSNVYHLEHQRDLDELIAKFKPRGIVGAKKKKRGNKR